jgi:hypothetical protein
MQNNNCLANICNGLGDHAGNKKRISNIEHGMSNDEAIGVSPLIASPNDHNRAERPFGALSAVRLIPHGKFVQGFNFNSIK